MHEELGVASIADLREACESGQVAELKGFGAKTQARLLDGIDLLARFRSRRRLDAVRPPGGQDAVEGQQDPRRQALQATPAC